MLLKLRTRHPGEAVAGLHTGAAVMTAVTAHAPQTLSAERKFHVLRLCNGRQLALHACATAT